MFPAMVYQFGPSGKQEQLSPHEPLQPHSPNPVEPLLLRPSSKAAPQGQGLHVAVGIPAALLLVGQPPLCLLYHFKNNMPPRPRAVYQVTQDKRGHFPVVFEVTGYWAWEIRCEIASWSRGWGNNCFSLKSEFSS